MEAVFEASPGVTVALPVRSIRPPETMVFATIVLLSLLGLAVYYTVEIIERLAIPWHISQQQTAADATM